WVMGVALTSAILAALAAVASLMAGHHANEAMIAQLQASDQWNYYQAKGIKKALMETRLETIRALGKKPKADDAEKFKQYDEDQKDIKEKAEDREKESREHLGHHVVLARGVTLFQVAIAISAISVLTKKRQFWLL